MEINDAAMKEIHRNQVENIFADILDERLRQIEKWGIQKVSLPEWMTILGKEFGESCQEALRCHFGFDGAPGEHMGDSRVVRFRREIVQVATVAFAILEFVDQRHPRVRGMINE